PLVLVSHAPLTPIFPAWQQWTRDAHRLAPLLARFRRVLCLHGHVHHTENRKPKTENPTHLPLPATAWPLPRPLEGTPSDLRPGLPPRGCGWGLLHLSSLSWEFSPRLWQV
ncbi:MAG: hypothetical protein JRI59_11805, partial [Deltaproteobacteria bacterium]|nr:hypothetical protein [Deltaproteobacteria bacterium]